MPIPISMRFASDPRFEAMLGSAKQRLGMAEAAE